MAKEKDKKPTNEPFRLSAQQLIEKTNNRDIISCSLSIDVGLGGGIPYGCTALVGGLNKIGKTTLVLQYAANGQNKFGSKIYYFNIEGRLTKLVLSQIRGLKLGENDFEIIMPPAILKDGDVIGHKKVSAEWWWDRIGEVLGSSHKAILIVDSISALSSDKEVSEDTGWQGRGDLQKLEAQFCRKFGDTIVPSQNILFLLAQLQANTSGYGETVQIKCGNAIKHTADAIIFCKSKTKWQEQDGRILGHDINARIDCSPLGPPLIETTVPLRYGYGIDDIKDILDYCTNFGMIHRGGAWYNVPFTENDIKTFDENFEPENKEKKYLSINGEKKLRDWLLINPEIARFLSDKIRKKIFG